ncbi:MAG: hypothetical protein JSU81_09680 [Candidatus Coatesbacteria bacterium]|nr:MAG: hypothetical protein JSU81_09680 [Candidatus Coatesbacteria bacterium]
MRKLLIGFAVLVVVAALFGACKKRTDEAPTSETVGTPETPATVEPPGGDPANGLALFTSADLGTSGKSCESCHPNGGTEGMEMEGMATEPLTGVKDRYPGIFEMMDPENEVTLAQVVNFCLTEAVEGEAWAEDSQEMKDMLAYLNSL